MLVTLKSFILTSFLLAVANCSVPLLLYSHKLVPRLQNYINSFNHLPFPPERAVEITKKIIEPCTSDAYIFVNQPGVTLDDLADYEDFKFLRTYSFMSSTLGAVPRCEKAVNFDSLVKYTKEKCGAIAITIDGYEEVETYIDSGTRVIRINFPELPPKSEPELRKEYLKAADEALRRTLRKLPSPSQTVIYTSLQDPPYVNRINEKRWSQMGIFPDISKDQSRQQEVERNNHVVDEKRELPEKRTNLLKVDDLKYSIAKYIDADLVIENEWLVLVIISIAFVFILKVIYDVINVIAGHFKSKKQTKTKKEK